MAERLTKKISETIQDKYSLGSYLYYDFAEIDDTNQLLNKLGELEDIMEKYGIESVEELEDKIICYEENKDVNLGLKLDIKKLEQELDTWKRACELASETLKQVMGKPLWIGGNIPTPEVKDSDYFYQQAKKEGDDE